VHGEQRISIARAHVGLLQDSRSMMTASRSIVRPERGGFGIRNPRLQTAVTVDLIEAAFSPCAMMLRRSPNRPIAACAEGAGPDAPRRAPFKTCQAVETETPGLRVTSAVVATLLSQCMDFVS
jgi:hypothetical protein